MDVNDVASPFAVTYEESKFVIDVIQKVVFNARPRHQRLYTQSVQETGVTHSPVNRLSAVCRRS